MPIPVDPSTYEIKPIGVDRDHAFAFAEILLTPYAHGSISALYGMFRRDRATPSDLEAAKRGTHEIRVAEFGQFLIEIGEHLRAVVKQSAKLGE